MDEFGEKKQLTREQKVGVAMLFVFAILTVSLAFLQVRNNLVQPFVLRTEQDGEAKTLSDFQVELQNIDTDKDGINDYEELNFYTTSPYLPDTDSDGAPDKQEIDAGTDPLCPEGDVCDSGESVQNINASSSPFLGFSQGNMPLPLGSSAEEINKEVQDLMQNPEKIRQLLLQTGQVPEQELSKLDDATLIQILQEIISGTGQKQPQTQPVDSNPATVSSSVFISDEEQNQP